MSSHEDKKDWRARVRAEMEMKICVWPRSPSPPKQKSKPVAKVVAARSESPERRSSSKSKKSEKSSKRDKSEKKKSHKSDRSERSERAERSEISNHSNKIEKMVHFDEEVEIEKERTAVIEETKNNAELEMQRALKESLGLNEYERAEMERFRRDVQGKKSGELSLRCLMGVNVDVWCLGFIRP